MNHTLIMTRVSLDHKLTECSLISKVIKQIIELVKDIVIIIKEI